MVGIKTLRSILVIQLCQCHCSQCDHTSRFPRLAMMRAGDSPHFKWSLDEGGFEPLTVGSIHENLIIESYPDTLIK